LVSALVTPNTAMKDRIAAFAASWNSCSAMAGRMLRSSPTMAPTKALTSTSSANWPRFSRRPRRRGALAMGQPASPACAAPR
jgi:hypothetical protein